MMTKLTNPLARSLIVGALVFVFALTFDLLLGREGITRFDLMVLGDLLAAAAFAGTYLIYASWSAERDRRIERRLKLVADMNHHIRNALQPIVYMAGLWGTPEQQRMVKDAVQRIDWALKEVLPGREESLGSAPNDSDKINKIHAPE